jgi:hypothetical protein
VFTVLHLAIARRWICFCVCRWDLLRKAGAAHRFAPGVTLAHGLIIGLFLVFPFLLARPVTQTTALPVILAPVKQVTPLAPVLHSLPCPHLSAGHGNCHLSPNTHGDRNGDYQRHSFAAPVDVKPQRGQR